MKTMIYAAALLTACSLAGTACAQGLYPPGLAAIRLSDNEIGIGITGNLLNYEEQPGAPLDSEHGWMGGLDARVSTMFDYAGLSNLYLGLDYGYAGGSVGYTGSLINGAPFKGSDQSSMNRVLARVGKGFVLDDSLMLTPYAAGGFQNWNRTLNYPNETYGAGLVGAGAMLQWAATPRLVLTADAQLLAVVGGNVSSTAPGYPTLNSQTFGASPEERIGLLADYALTGPLHVWGGLDLTHFTYTGAPLHPLSAGFYEPNSATSLFELKAGLALSF
jgi:hypothetical protein